MLVKVVCVGTDGPDSSGPLKRKVRGSGQHFRSAAVGREPASPPCHRDFNFTVPESLRAATVLRESRCVKCSEPFPCDRVSVLVCGLS